MKRVSLKLTKNKIRSLGFLSPMHEQFLKFTLSQITRKKTSRINSIFMFQDSVYEKLGMSKQELTKLSQNWTDGFEKLAIAD